MHFLRTTQLLELHIATSLLTDVWLPIACLCMWRVHLISLLLEMKYHLTLVRMAITEKTKHKHFC